MKTRVSLFLLTPLILLLTPAISSADIRFQNFSFAEPESELLTTEDQDAHRAVFTAAVNGAHFQLTFQENFVIADAMKNLPAEVFADVYRKQEQQHMIEMGVKQGLYELEDLITGEERVGDRLFYTMTYTAKLENAIQFAQLYLYLPDQKEVSHFLVAHYSEAVPSQEHISPSFKNIFLNMLETVSYKVADEDPTIADASAGPERLPEFFAGVEAAFRKVAYFKQLGKTLAIKNKGEVKCSIRMKEEGAKFYSTFYSTRSPSGLNRPDVYMFTGKKVSQRKLKNFIADQDFGYIFDRNQDGKVDLFSYNIGPDNPVPACMNGPIYSRAGVITLNLSIMHHLISTTIQNFWHLADDNYDGRHDGFVIRLRNASTRWLEGWMYVSDTDFDGDYDSCHWYAGRFGVEPRPCDRNGNRFIVPAWEYGAFEVTPNDMHDWLGLINRSAQACREKSEEPMAFYSSPEMFLGEDVILLEPQCLPDGMEESVGSTDPDIADVRQLSSAELADRYLHWQEVMRQLEEYGVDDDKGLGTMVGTRQGYRLVTLTERGEYEEATRDLLDLYTAVINERGFENIGGGWALDSVSGCKSLPSKWITEWPDFITISQNDFLIGAEDKAGVVIDKTLAFPSSDDENLALRGEIGPDSIVLKPAADRVVENWSTWSRPPSYRQLLACELLLVRKQ